MLDIKNERISYDVKHDILYIFFGSPMFAYDDEISPGVFLRKEDDTDEVIGAVIMGYKQFPTSSLKNLLPFRIDFNFINNNYVH